MFAQEPLSVKLFQAFNFGGSNNTTPYSLVFSNKANDHNPNNLNDYVPYVTESSHYAIKQGLLRFEELNQQQ